MAGRTPSVLIVGAGSAGIAAATRLLDRGFCNLTILEAENRLGGRIHSVRRGGNVLDYGAQWFVFRLGLFRLKSSLTPSFFSSHFFPHRVHGKENNFIYDMASQYGLIEVEQHKENDLYYKSTGELVPKETSDRVLETLHTLLEEDAAGLQSYTGSLGAYYDQV